MNSGKPAREPLGAQGARPMDTMEPPYTVKEVADLTGFSVQTVIRIFEHEPGVIIYEQKRPRKRQLSNNAHPALRISARHSEVDGPMTHITEAIILSDLTPISDAVPFTIASVVELVGYC